MKKLIIALCITALWAPSSLHCMQIFEDEIQEYDPTTEIQKYTVEEDDEVAPMPAEPPVIFPVSPNPCRQEDLQQEMYVFAQNYPIAASPFYSSAPQDKASMPINRQQTPEAPIAEPFTPPISQPLPTPAPLSQTHTPTPISLFNQILQKTRPCPKCKKFIGLQVFLKHIKAHKTRPLKCPFEACPFSYESKKSFKYHIHRYHSNQELYVCHQYNPKALK